MPRVRTPIAPSPYELGRRTFRLCLLAGVGLLLWVGPKSTWAQEVPVELSVELPDRVPAQFMSYLGAEWLERPERIAEEMPDEMLAAMGLQDGDVVADIGVGSGFHTRRMARLVAPTGEVFAVDIQPEMLEILRGHVEREGLTGITPVLSEMDDPKLPEDAIDWILLVDVYHEFSNPERMLARMRQALKADGKVALVEYRVEDGTGDHIKADHRMSVHQVLSEWKPAGFKLIELHEFLPGQHIFIFQPAGPEGAAGVESPPAIADYDILEAMAEGLVEVDVSGMGPESVKVTIRRTRPELMVITFPVGTYFESLGGTSDMIARRDGVVVLREDGRQDWTVLTRKVHRTRPVPQSSDELEIRVAEDHIAERNVMWLFQGMGMHPVLAPVIEPFALWMASEDAGYDDLAELAADAPIPMERAIALAAAYVEQALIDITQKRIWGDREKFVPALTDPALKRVFENRNQR